MGSLDDILPLPAPRPIDADDALAATIHALAAVAAGVAAMQLLSAVALGDHVSAAFHAVVLAGSGTCAFMPEDLRLRRGAFLAGGAASVLVWLSVAAEATVAATVVAALMVGASLAATRAVLASSRSDPGWVAALGDPASPAAWITDDREGRLAA